MRIALCLGHDARLVSVSLFLQAGRRAHCAWNHIVGVGLGFVLCPFAFLARFEHIVERCLHLLWRAHPALLQIDAHHLNTHLVAVQDGLHQGAHARRNLVPILRQSRVHAQLANHLAYRSLGCLHHCIRRILALEQKGAGITQAVLDGELDLDDVFVFGQHRRLAQSGGLDHGVAAHIHGTYLRNKYQFVALDRIRQAPVEAGRFCPLVFTELRDDRLLPLVDDEEPGAQPDQDGDCSDQPSPQTGAFHVRLKSAGAATPAATGIATAAKQAAEFAVEIAPQLVQIRRPLVGTFSTRAIAVVLRWWWWWRWWILRRGVLRFGRVALVGATPARIVQTEHAAGTLAQCDQSGPGYLHFHLSFSQSSTDCA